MIDFDPKETNKKPTDTPEIQQKNIDDDGDETNDSKKKEVIKNSSYEMSDIKGNPDVLVN